MSVGILIDSCRAGMQILSQRIACNCLPVLRGRGLREILAEGVAGRTEAVGLNGEQSGAVLQSLSSLIPSPLSLSLSGLCPLADDLDVSVDFFEYFLATFPLLEEDPTLWCVSAWNDNGKEARISNDAGASARSLP